MIKSPFEGFVAIWSIFGIKFVHVAVTVGVVHIMIYPMHCNSHCIVIIPTHQYHIVMEKQSTPFQYPPVNVIPTPSQPYHSFCIFLPILFHITPPHHSIQIGDKITSLVQTMPSQFLFDIHVN